MSGLSMGCQAREVDVVGECSGEGDGQLERRVLLLRRGRSAWFHLFHRHPLKLV